LHRMRAVKSENEIKVMRKAYEAGSLGLRVAMKALEVGKGEQSWRCAGDAQASQRYGRRMGERIYKMGEEPKASSSPNRKLALYQDKPGGPRKRSSRQRIWPKPYSTGPGDRLKKASQATWCGHQLPLCPYLTIICRMGLFSKGALKM
jgi:hypothetical protein